jgi:hypothetical protein
VLIAAHSRFVRFMPTHARGDWPLPATAWKGRPTTARPVAAATLIAHGSLLTAHCSLLTAHCSRLPMGGFSGIFEKGPKNVVQAIDKLFAMV